MAKQVNGVRFETFLDEGQRHRRIVELSGVDDEGRAWRSATEHVRPEDESYYVIENGTKIPIERCENLKQGTHYLVATGRDGTNLLFRIEPTPKADGEP